MSDSAAWVVPTADGCLLRLHVRPGASRSGVGGLHGEALIVRVRARPVEGTANREVLAVLADVLGCRTSDLTLAAGARGREKRVGVRGLTAEAVRARLGSVDKAGGRA